MITDFSVLGEGLTDDINGSVVDAEQRQTFFGSLYNGDSSSLFVNGKNLEV